MQAALSRRTLLASLAAAAVLPRVATAAPAPDWAHMELLDADDRSFRLGQSPRPLTLVMLWANWCGICTRELDTLGSIVPALGDGVVDIVLVSHPNDWSADQMLLRRRNLALPTARPSPHNAPSSLQRALLSDDGTFYVPRALLFSRSRGEVVWSHVGGLDWRRPETTNRLRPFLPSPFPAA